MCLAIYKPSKVSIDWDALEEGFRCNSHGAGFVTVHGGKLTISKGFFTFDAFRAAYLPYERMQAAIHFRLATHGEKDAGNCHPFPVTDEIAMIHNGVLPIDTSDDKSRSDTWHYVEYVLKPLAAESRSFYSHSSIKFLGEAAISGSKFVFLRADGDWTIWNQDEGHWADDVWFSNKSYQKSFGFASWPKRMEIVGDPPADEPDTDESRFYDYLTYKEQAIYEGMLRDGYTCDEIDSEIGEYGGLKHMERWMSYDEEEA
jgi:glutamine amidotransferase